MATTDVALERTSLSRSGAIRPTTRRSNPGGPRGARIDSIFGRAAAAAQPDHSDAVRVWNLHAVDALVNAPTAPIPGAGQTPRVSQLHLAIMHGAVYDAVNSIDGGYQPVSTRPPTGVAVGFAGGRGCNGRSSGARRARVTPPLSQVVRDRLDALYAETLAGIPDGSAKPDGIAAGAAAARAPGLVVGRDHVVLYSIADWPRAFVSGDDMQAARRRCRSRWRCPASST